jgi:hypothetical protein
VIACVVPAPAVSARRSGDHEDGKLVLLRRQYPRWWIWRGRFTDDYWAMPPRDHPAQHDLIGASDADELGRLIAQAEGRYAL